MSLLDRIVEYEKGNLTDNEIVHFFSELIKTKKIKEMPAHYHSIKYALMENYFLDEEGNIL